MFVSRGRGGCHPSTTSECWRLLPKAKQSPNDGFRRQVSTNHRHQCVVVQMVVGISPHTGGSGRVRMRLLQHFTTVYVKLLHLTSRRFSFLEHVLPNTCAATTACLHHNYHYTKQSRILITRVHYKLTRPRNH